MTKIIRCNRVGFHYNGFLNGLENSNPAYTIKSSVKFSQKNYIRSNCGIWARSSIIRVLYQLPEDVVIFALDRCSFVSVGKAASGMVLPGKIGVHSQKKRSRNCWLIILDERSTDDESVIAHEIAHAWLGHDRISAYDTETWEIDAANLTKSWGFKGRGSDADFCDF